MHPAFPVTLRVESSKKANPAPPSCYPHHIPCFHVVSSERAHARSHSLISFASRVSNFLPCPGPSIKNIRASPQPSGFKRRSKESARRRNPVPPLWFVYRSEKGKDRKESVREKKSKNSLGLKSVPNPQSPLPAASQPGVPIKVCAHKAKREGGRSIHRLHPRCQGHTYQHTWVSFLCPPFLPEETRA